MIARFPGRCGLCQRPIEEGDEIVQLDDEWVHEACADDEEDDR
jgi:hypothetical protein